MPSKTPRQARFMAMAANPKSRGKMKGKKPPFDVAQEFNQADKGTEMMRKAAKGARMKRGKK